MSSESNDFSTTESTEVTHNAPNFTKEKHFYLNRNHEFVECELIKETTHRRLIKILEGEGSGAGAGDDPRGQGARSADLCNARYADRKPGKKAKGCRAVCI